MYREKHEYAYVIEAILEINKHFSVSYSNVYKAIAVDTLL